MITSISLIVLVYYFKLIFIVHLSPSSMRLSQILCLFIVHLLMSDIRLLLKQ